jgi:hypothetical protein
MKIVGILLIIWGIADFGLSWIEIDLYWKIGIQLPAAIYPYTAFIAMSIGYVIFAIPGPDESE